MVDFLRACVKTRLNIVISGGTSTGKTTLLNVLSSFLPDNERIVTIEDAAELQLQQPHVVRMETRPPNIEGKGEIRQRELVKNALRMRPERIILGECRGGEALDMLQEAIRLPSISSRQREITRAACLLLFGLLQTPHGPARPLPQEGH
jgi:pilus assembly protein CpaF